jgi:hypothetical protein
MALGRPVHPLAEHGGGVLDQFDDHSHGDRGPERRADAESLRSDRLASIVTYVHAWSLTDEAALRADLTRCWSENGTHVSPFTDVVRGIDALARLILDYPSMFPGAVLSMTSVPDLHHDVGRFDWRLESTRPIRILGRDFGQSMAGLTVVEFDQAAGIRRVNAFFGPLEPLTEKPAHAPAAIARARGWAPAYGTP